MTGDRISHVGIIGLACPSPLLSGSTPSSFPVWISILVYTYTLYSVKGGYGILGLRQISTCHEVSLHVNFFRWRHFAMPSVSLIFLRVKVSRKNSIYIFQVELKTSNSNSWRFIFGKTTALLDINADSTWVVFTPQTKTVTYELG